MTLILAAKDSRGRVYIGSDSRWSNGYTYGDGRNKLISQHNYVVGCSGSFRMIQIIEHSVDRFQPVSCDADMFKWVNTLRDLLLEHGFKKESSDRDDPMNNAVQLILAAPHTPYMVDTNYQFYPVVRGSVGCGYLYGQGYFDALSPNSPLGKRIETAIVRTSDIMSGVSPDATVIQVKRKRDAKAA